MRAGSRGKTCLARPKLLPAQADQVSAAAKPRRILIVDDNRDAAESLAMLLKLHRHETRTAHDPDQAMELAASMRPDVIILDLGLPRISGYELAKQIRSHEWGAKVKLIAVTGWGQEDDIRRSHEAGFEQHLVKPVDLKLLTKIIAE